MQSSSVTKNHQDYYINSNIDSRIQERFIRGGSIRDEGFIRGSQPIREQIRGDGDGSLREKRFTRAGSIEQGFRRGPSIEEGLTRAGSIRERSVEYRRNTLDIYSSDPKIFKKPKGLSTYTTTKDLPVNFFINKEIKNHYK